MMIQTIASLLEIAVELNGEKKDILEYLMKDLMNSIHLFFLFMGELEFYILMEYMEI